MTGSRVVTWGGKKKVRDKERKEGEQETKCNYRGVIEQLTSHQSQVKKVEKLRQE